MVALDGEVPLEAGGVAAVDDDIEGAGAGGCGVRGSGGGRSDADGCGMGGGGSSRLLAWDVRLGL